jgi:hypothetical protein
MDALYDIFTKFADTLTKVLPISPFHPYIYSFSQLPFLPFLNWFIPVGDIVIIGTSWLLAIGVFYAYSIIMRWVKMIGD